MNPDTPATAIDDIRTWRLPLGEIDDSLFTSLLTLVVDQSEVVDYFPADFPLEEVRNRLAELEDFPLLRFGEEDGPCFEAWGIIWDNARSEGVLYRGFSIDVVYPLTQVIKLTPECVFPLVIDELLGGEGLNGLGLELIDSAIVFSEEGSTVSTLNSDLDSITWGPDGFEVYDSELVPRVMMREVITQLYRTAKNEKRNLVVEQCPTPQDWLNAVYG
ncbi:MAG: hypothetical protein KJO21_06965 [Verrucomicrobiae bacterium]|nr:hypothetical protein [Verrucomicrobiae bacterium]NNJ42495.1 hypothetical protein [Akkermansiaceae bacterium]